MREIYYDLMKEALMIEVGAINVDCPIRTPALNQKAKEMRELAEAALREEIQGAIYCTQTYYINPNLWSS